MNTLKYIKILMITGCQLTFAQSVAGNYECQADFGWVNNLPSDHNFAKEITWNPEFEYYLSKNFSQMTGSDNGFDAGSGLSMRF